MNDSRKTKAQLIEELQALRDQLAACSDAEPSTRPGLDAEQLAQLASKGTWVVDTDFVVRVANEAMCRMLDVPAHDVVGRKCYDLMRGESCRTDACAMRRAFAASQSVAGDDTLRIADVPIACRVVAHLVHDRGKEMVGIVEQLDEAQASQRPDRSHRALPQFAQEPATVPTTAEGTRLANAALELASAVRNSGTQQQVEACLARVERACKPWKDLATATAAAPSKAQGKPGLRTVAPERSVLMVAPLDSRIREAWADTIRRAGYALLTPERDDAVSNDDAAGPTVAILDLALGESATDELHKQLREAHPSMPILVVSSLNNGALEARRWRRTLTWYIPRAVAGDELMRLIEDVTPRPVLRTRPER